ncbi:MAG: response regulator [Gammaproteobacteria bacterium]|nr:response regulator [Gammaproteobacteria bacterium]
MDAQKRKFSILVVDDMPENIDIIKSALVPDYHVQATTNGRHALILAASAKQPDLILLDIMMPEMDGYEVCACLKTDKNTRDIPVIFVTAMREEKDETKGLELGAVDYITKPVRQAILKARVKNHLNLKLAHEELAEKNEELAQKNKKLEELALLREDVERITRHDLKGPLSGIITIPEILVKKSDLSGEQKGLLKTVAHCGYQMLNMINHSLDLYKMEAGTYEYTPDIVELVSMLHKIMAEKEVFLKDKDISIDILLHGRPADKNDRFIVQGETLLCYSLFANLLKNALEASPEKMHVTVSLEEKDVCFITIHNQGAVPKKIRKHFFERYVTAGKSQGTGLGTYSAKLMAETQRGGISLQTSDKTGTAVTVCLPKAE